MSREFSDLYRSLAADADGPVLTHPELLRRRADRRARSRAVGTALVVALLVGGTAVGGRLVFAADGPAPLPPADTPGPVPSDPTPSTTSPSPSAVPSRTTPSGTPTRTAPTTDATTRRPPTSIPDRAFFVLAPANRTGLDGAISDGTALPVPELCGARYPSESAVVQRRDRVLAYKMPDTPAGNVPDGSYRHSITIYQSGRADDALRELRQAVRDCPERKTPDNPAVTWRQRLLDPGEYGDESVLFEMRAPYADGMGEPGGHEVRLIRAVRMGDVVTVLWEQGWENTAADRAVVDADSRRAVAAIENWLD
ncbi:hypothetical protein [Micromonospora sp. WMMD812]|uniref:hypothetical protein n=1 Tax=Micromonospora sp. WMMD812 TaxID=3015152 RepID=UPI00248CEFC5|nr:hypothetical protein [Micromonospora sp. WMMD812]WBB66588.1 hypothetical protein O7603_26090 [Micromonospora sp. WMMD812]